VILHTLNASPGSRFFIDCLATAANGDTVLLLGDGIYGALPSSAACELLRACPAEVLILDDDARAAGVTSPEFRTVDMEEFVTLTERYARQLAWY